MDLEDWTPAQHKTEALRLLHEAAGQLFPANAAITLARAQLHATLGVITALNPPTEATTDQ